LARFSSRASSLENPEKWGSLGTILKKNRNK